MHRNFPLRCRLCLMFSHLLMMSLCAAGQQRAYKLLQHSERCECTSPWVVGALHCDRNMCWEDQLQACPFKDMKEVTYASLTLLGCFTPRQWGKPLPPSTAVWKCMKNSPGLAPTAAIHQHSDRSEFPTLLSPTLSVWMKMVRFGAKITPTTPGFGLRPINQ